jgi:hypothetical protein
MPGHRFEVGQRVVAPGAGPRAQIPRGPYVVVRQLPAQDGEPQYHLRSEVDGHQRVLLEGQIRAVRAAQADGPSNG